MTATVHMRHLRELGYCARGCRHFAARHGLDWRAFLERGVPAEQLAATGDAMAARAAERAEREHAGVRHG